jgi:Domain of unknown function DUF29
MNSLITTKTLYEYDYCLWTENTIEQLKKGDFHHIDIDNLIEEIEAMGRSEKSALESNLRVLLMHLLKWKYQQNKRSNSWRGTIREHRLRIIKAFRNSPSLKSYYLDILPETYEDSRYLASDETGLKLEIFPSNCPLTDEQILDTNYLPD